MVHDDSFFRPIGGSEVPRFAGRSTFMRLPQIEDPGRYRAYRLALGQRLYQPGRSASRAARDSQQFHDDATCAPGEPHCAL